MVPTVDRGFRDAAFWSIDTAGDNPSMKSTSGLSIWPRNCRAYADRDSTYRRCPSAKIVSNARLAFPDPDNQVNTIMESRGSSSDTSFRLCSRAPRTTRRSATALCSPGHGSPGHDDGSPGQVGDESSAHRDAPCYSGALTKQRSGGKRSRLRHRPATPPAAPAPLSFQGAIPLGDDGPEH